jgi:hypothetical protein
MGNNRYGTSIMHIMQRKYIIRKVHTWIKYSPFNSISHLFLAVYILTAEYRHIFTIVIY